MFLIIFVAYMNILVIMKVRFLLLIEWLYEVEH